MPEISIILASNNASNLSGFLTHLDSVSENPVNVYVAVDEILPVPATKHNVKQYVYNLPRGYYSLDIAYNDLLTKTPDYFIAVFSDKVRIKTKGWDSIVKRYQGSSKDVFRLRISPNKGQFITSFNQAFRCPENFPIFSRKWLQLSEGFGDYWGPDSSTQIIATLVGDCDIITEIELDNYQWSSGAMKEVMFNWAQSFFTNGYGLKDLIDRANCITRYLANPVEKDDVIAIRSDQAIQREIQKVYDRYK